MKRAHYGEILKKMAELVDLGIIKVLIDEKAYTIDQVGDAHKYLEKGDALGKVVLKASWK
jgi:NADPH:quinone reductase